MYIIFDTETNGLPKNWKAQPTDVNNWPRIVQLGWAVFNEQGQQVRGRQHIIKPDGWIIPKEASDVHGITLERANDEGISIFSALGLFLADYQDAHTLIAHNLAFDYPVVTAELIRAGLRATKKVENKVCTMESSTKYCKIPGPSGRGYKWPKLEELHQFLFLETFEGAHDAMVDVLACARCFFELKKRGIIR